MAEALVPLWCASGGLIDPRSEADEADVRAFVRKCADHGVTRLFPSGGTKMLVGLSRELDIEVDPYGAFNSHGGLPANYDWSVKYTVARLGSADARAILDRHRPIYSPSRSEPRMSEIAKSHPEYRTKSRQGNDTLAPDTGISLSLAFPEAKAFEEAKFLRMLESTGGSGIQIEFLLGEVDEHGVNTGGYESAIANAFEKRFGKDPKRISNDDPDWIAHRASYVTEFLRGFRAKLASSHPAARLSITLIARERDDYLNDLQDWPTWVDNDLLDELYLWFRTTSDLREVERLTSYAATRVNGRVPLIAELSCYHPGSFQDSQVLLEAARRAKGSGADAVGVYRGHAVDQLDLWHVLSRIAAL